MTNLCAFLLGSFAYLCTPIPEKPPLYITSYDWRLGGHNCDSDCGFTALSVPTADWLLDRAAACPSAWLGYVTTTVLTLPDGTEHWCIDTFGQPEHRQLWWHPEAGWVYRIDLASADVMNNPWNQALVYDYWTSWEPTQELFWIGDLLEGERE
jgi:hypothetical protein